MFDMTLGNLLILFLTIVFGFYMAWTIGANDVANSMGTVFGSRTLSLKRIIMIAVVFEFLGAFLVGAHVTKTLKAGIVDPAPFQDPALFPGDQGIYIFIAGMLAVLLAASLWVTLATYWKLPISTSQSIVGAVAGFGIISIFLGDIPSKALSLGTLAKISTGWILSPVFGGMVSFLIFLSIKKMVFESGDIESRANKANHLFVFLVVFILLLAGLSGGLKNLRSVVASILPGTPGHDIRSFPFESARYPCHFRDHHVHILHLDQEEEESIRESTISLGEGGGDVRRSSRPDSMLCGIRPRGQ